MEPSRWIRTLCPRAALLWALATATAGCGDDDVQSERDDSLADDAGVVDAATAGCTPGSEGCACSAGDRCDDGLTCDHGVCGQGATLAPLAFPAQARSCELLLREHGAAVLSIAFASDTAGSFVREAPRVAVALHALSDAPMGELEVHVTGGGDRPTTERTHCFDASGEALPDVELQFGG